MTTNIGLMKALTAKMNYLDQRQNLISQNVANADTPDYRPKDLEKVDFGRVLKRTLDKPTIYTETTNKGHIPSLSSAKHARIREDRETYEVAPDGNAVVIEEQLIRASKTSMDYNLMTSLYQKNMGMMRIALGVGR